MGTWLGNDEDDLSALARGLEVVTGFDQWEQWIANRHTVGLLGNCAPDVEETTDMDTQVWPKQDVPGLAEALPHGWFTMLEAAYEHLGDSDGLAKVYAIYIAQGRLPQDSRYVDRLHWLLGDTTELAHMLGELTSRFQCPEDGQMNPVASLSYEHLLREFELSNAAVSYCDSLRKHDQRCVRRLTDTIAIGNAYRMRDLGKTDIDWNTRFEIDDVDFLVSIVRADLEDRMPVFFVNGYVDPIVEDIEALIRSAAVGNRVRCRLVACKRFPTGKPATVARDILLHAEGLISNDSNWSVILDRAIAMVGLRADYLARTFFIEDDVVVFAAPLDETTLQANQPHDFMEALRLVDVIDGVSLTHEGTLNGVLDPARATDKDLEIVRHVLKDRINQAKMKARFEDIVTGVDDDYDHEQDSDLMGLRECLDVQINALFGSRFSMDAVQCDDLFDPPVTVGQRNKWLRPTAGQLGVWTAMYVLNFKRHEQGELSEATHLPHFLAAKGLKSAMIDMLDHMLGVTAMLGIPRAQVDVDEYRALHLLRIDPHPETGDAHGNVAMLRPDHDFTVPYMLNVLRHAHPNLQLVDVNDERHVRGMVSEVQMFLRMLDSDSTQHHDFDDDLASETEERANNGALALALAVLVEPDAVLPLIDDPSVARLAAEQAKQAYMMFWHVRDENDTTPADDDDAAGHEADITDAGNVMLMLLERAYTRLMDTAEPGYKDW